MSESPVIDALDLEDIAFNIKAGLNAIFSICITMETGKGAAKDYADGLYFVHQALEEQSKKLCAVVCGPEEEMF